MQTYTAEVTDIDLTCHHGEGPFCDPRTGEVLWVDGTAATLNRFDPLLGAASLRTARVGARAGFARPHREGGWLLAVDGAIRRLRSFDEPPVHLVDLPGGPDVLVNDGAADPWGRLWAGTMSGGGTTGAADLWLWPGSGDRWRSCQR